MVAELHDDFNRADNTDVGSAWIEDVGDFRIVSNRLETAVTSTSLLVNAAPNLDSANNWAEITWAYALAPTSGFSGYLAGVVVKYSNTNNYYTAYAFRPGTGQHQIILQKRVGGVNTTLASVNVTFSTATLETLRLQIVDNELKVYRNGAVVITHINSDVPAGLKVGIRANAQTPTTRAPYADRFDAGLAVRKLRVGLNTVDSVYAGSSEADRVYHGTNLVFEK